MWDVWEPTDERLAVSFPYCISMRTTHRSQARRTELDLTRSTVLKPAPGVYSTLVGAEAVLLSQSDGTYYGVNEIGARIWQYCEEGRPLGEAHKALTEEFLASDTQIWADVRGMCRELLRLGLLVVVKPTSTDPLQE